MSSPELAGVMVDGPWTHREISANGMRFHAAEMGDGPLVVLLHGFPQFWWSMRHQLEALAHAGYRGVAPDLRGYGGSDKPPRGYDAITLASDVAGVIRALGARDAVVVGHDWGGFAAWATAALQPTQVRAVAALAAPHPLRFRNALLAEPRGQLRASTHLLGFQRPWVPERQLVSDDAAQVGRMLHAWSGPGWPDAETARRYRAQFQIPHVAHSALEYYRWLLRSQLRPDGVRFTRAMRNPIRVPTLQLHGALDSCVLPRTAAGSGRYVGGPYSWRIVEDAGHFLQEEAPKQVNAELVRWLDELDRSR
ncbi:MAG: alpha/beta fold hydrolase [Acidothermaceae bacterium]